jgi:hypothetical protein
LRTVNLSGFVKTMSDIKDTTQDNTITKNDQQQTSFAPSIIPKLVEQTPTPSTVKLPYKNILLRKKWIVTAESKTQFIKSSMYEAFKDSISGKGQVRFHDFKLTVVSKSGNRGKIVMVTHAENEGPDLDYYDMLCWPNAVGWQYNNATSGNHVQLDVPVIAAISNQLYPPTSDMPAPYISVYQEGFEGMVNFTMLVDCQKIVFDDGNF